MKIVNSYLAGNIFIETFFFFFFTAVAALLFHITNAKELNHVTLVKGNRISSSLELLKEFILPF